MHNLTSLVGRLLFMLMLIIASTIVISLPVKAESDGYNSSWSYAWPNTDFSKHSVNLSEIMSGGPPRDGIPPIDHPKFKPVSQITNIGSKEPVISLVINGKAKAYPLQVMTWHEIANDTIGGVPVTVTYCPLCNAAIVFDRRLNGKTLDFGTSGNLRNSDLVMYDRQTDSWWQQFLGEAIVGEMTGAKLKRLPARLESFRIFKIKYPDGLVLIPNDRNARRYGKNPYVGYDRSKTPFLYRGDMPKDVPPMMRVVVAQKTAWTLPLLQKQSIFKTKINGKNLKISWQKGQNSALDTGTISKGQDIGNIIVQQQQPDNSWQDVPYDVTFAFVFHAFHPKGIIHK